MTFSPLLNRLALIGFWLAVVAALGACEVVTVDEHEFDLEEPYIPQAGPKKAVALHKSPDSPMPVRVDAIETFYKGVSQKMAEGQLGPALADLDSFLATTQGAAAEKAYYLKARILLMQQRLDEARTHIQKALMLYSSGVYTPQLMAMLRALRGDAPPKSPEKATTD